MSVFTVQEKETSRYTATVKDEAGVAQGSSARDTLTLTPYDKETGTIINSRNAQNVLNANGVTVDSSGNLVWTMDPADNTIVTATNEQELHVALFEWTYSTTKKGKHEVILLVQNLVKV